MKSIFAAIFSFALALAGCATTAPDSGEASTSQALAGQVTAPVPLFTSFSTPVLTSAAYITTDNNAFTSSFAVAQISVPVGAVITNVTARIQDNPVASCYLTIYDQSDWNFGRVTDSPRSTRTATVQNLSVDLNIAATTLHSYYVVLNEQQSPISSPCYWFSAQVTYTPPL